VPKRGDSEDEDAAVDGNILVFFEVLVVLVLVPVVAPRNENPA